MFYSTTRYQSIAESAAEYAKRIREWERQRKYERSIVCSVPVSSIEPVSFDEPTTDRWKPG